MWGGSDIYYKLQRSHAIYNTKLGKVIAIMRDSDYTTNHFK